MTSPEKSFFEDDHWCYACGTENHQGLQLKFEHSQKGQLSSTVIFSKQHQGFKGVVHGGMLAVVLDDIMVNLAWHEKYRVVTGELTLRLKRPAKIGEALSLLAWFSRIDSKIIYLESSVKNPKGDVVATAKASCVILTSQSQA